MNIDVKANGPVQQALLDYPELRWIPNDPFPWVNYIHLHEADGFSYAMTFWNGDFRAFKVNPDGTAGYVPRDELPEMATEAAKRFSVSHWERMKNIPPTE